MKNFRQQEDWAIEKLKHNFEEFMENEIQSEFLAHYCSSTAAISIIQSGQVYFSPMDSMNDHREFKFLYEKIVVHLLIEIEKSHNLNNKEMIIEIIDHLQKSKNVQKNNSYVFCLSMYNKKSDVDNLSMWRAYASDGEGCALIFETKTLLMEDIEGQFPISGWKVRYLTEEIAEELSHSIANKIITAISQIKSDDISENLIGIKAYITSKVSDICFASKHKGFSEEKEVRLVYRFEYDLEPKTFNPCAQILGGKVNARLPVLLTEYNKYKIDLSLSKILHSVMVGPSPNQSHIMKALYLSLGEQNFKCSQETLSPSKTPYRRNRR